jgi:hypothetical protein
MDEYFRWFEGEKAQFRFVPYDWAFLFLPSAKGSPKPAEGKLKLPPDIHGQHADEKAAINLKARMGLQEQPGRAGQTRSQQSDGHI